MYQELIKKIRDKGVSNEKIDAVLSGTMKALEHSDSNAYDEFKMRLESLAYSITERDAEHIVRNMQPKGQMWSYDQIKHFVEDKGYTDDFVDWYLVMNMCYNDYYNTAKTYGLQNEVDFYFNLARDFIEDPDAKPFKVAKYFS